MVKQFYVKIILNIYNKIKMKTLRTTVFTGAITLTALVSISCKDGNKNEAAVPMSNQMHQQEVNDSGEVANNDAQHSMAEDFVSQYLSIKNALVADNTDKAAEAGIKLVAAFNIFDVSNFSDAEQAELKDIIVEAKAQAEHISNSPIEKQREHFKTLNKAVTDMLAITGTDKKLYEQFCPMYDKGSAWLSMSEEVKNPYYGSKMLTCGKVQKEIN